MSRTVAPDGRIPRRLYGRRVDADVDPLGPVSWIGPDIESESVGEPPQIRPVPVDCVDDLLAANREDYRRSIRGDERFRIAGGIAHHHALAPTVLRVVRHERELVALAGVVAAVPQVTGPYNAQVGRQGLARLIADPRPRRPEIPTVLRAGEQRDEQTPKSGQLEHRDGRGRTRPARAPVRMKHRSHCSLSETFSEQVAALHGRLPCAVSPPSEACGPRPRRPHEPRIARRPGVR